MRLHRRRTRRSLHDLDNAHADTTSFADSVPTLHDDERFDWVEMLVADHNHQERVERGERRRIRRRQTTSLTNARLGPATAAYNAAVDAMQNDAMPPATQHTIPAADNRLSYQLTQRVPHSVIRDFEHPNDLDEIVRAQLQRQLRAIIQTRHPTTSLDRWGFREEHQRSPHTQEEVFTITARRSR